jgi:putative redox protein
MEGTVKWVDGVMFLGESSSGHSVVMDGPEELGGKNHGLRPMEMLLLGPAVARFLTSSRCLKNHAKP